MNTRRLHALGVIAVALSCAVVVSGSGCGSAPARVSDEDRDLIFTPLYEGKPFSRQLCGAVAGPLPHGTADGYAAMIRVAAQDPVAELQNPDDPNDHPPIRQWMAGAAEVIGICRAKVREGPGWRDLEARMREAAR